jgi:hypothetical protein
MATAAGARDLCCHHHRQAARRIRGLAIRTRVEQDINSTAAKVLWHLGCTSDAGGKYHSDYV